MRRWNSEIIVQPHLDSLARRLFEHASPFIQSEKEAAFVMHADVRLCGERVQNKVPQHTRAQLFKTCAFQLRRQKHILLKPSTGHTHYTSGNLIYLPKITNGREMGLF